jgi:hypothetical protein
MKIVSITLTRNESDLVESFVRHHAEIFDRLFLYVHRCDDNTDDILERLVAEGLPIAVGRYDAADGDLTGVRHVREGLGITRTAAFLTQAMREVVEREAPDFVSILDMDEFLSTYDASSARERIEELPSDRLSGALWRCYVPSPGDDVEEASPVRRIQMRKDREPDSPKLFIPRPLAADDGLVVANGSHHLIDEAKGVALPMNHADRLFVGHFPVRSERQLRTKILSGYLSYMANPIRPFLGAFQWQKLYPRCADPTPMSPDELAEIARTYAQLPDAPEPKLERAPIRTGSWTLRYPAQSIDPWRLLARNAEHLANEVSRLSTERLARESGGSRH